MERFSQFALTEAPSRKNMPGRLHAADQYEYKNLFCSQ
jgi:hypothetical protein